MHVRIAMQPLPTLEPRRHERGYRGAFVPPQKRNLRWWSARTTRQGGRTRERERKIGERWRNDEDDRKGYASRPSRNSRREGR